MKKAAVVTLCFILSVFAGTSFATEVTLFGPKKYVRTTGDPNVFTDSFTAISGPGVLIVKNGSMDGNNRITDAISSASVYVNGEQIFGPSDFNQNIYLLQAPVNLTENNSITIELASSPGSYLTIEVTEDVDPPTVSLSADPETILLAESAILTWSSTTANTCVIEPDIGAVDVNGSIQISPMETTTYTITAAGLGGTATAMVEVAVILERNLDNGFYPNSQLGGNGVVGERICMFNGNVAESRLDIQFSSPNSLGFLFQATYNSRSDNPGVLGYGWSHTYSAVLDPAYDMAGQTYLKIVDQTGRPAYFKEENVGVYKGEFNEHSQIKAEAGGYVWYHLDGRKYGFSAAGQLLWIDDEKDNRLLLGYDAQNRLQTVTDTSTGRVLTFNYTVGNLLESISGPVSQSVSSGIWVTYGYDAAQNLISVTYADDSGFDYTYSDTNDVHNLTEKRDKAGHLINTWAFDDKDRAVSNFSLKGRGVSVQYIGETQVDVTDAYGTIRSYSIAYIDGRKRVTAMQGFGGAPYIDSNVIRWGYDSQMNLVEVEILGGTIYQYLNYDVRGNPGTVILADGTSEERVITYTYHPDLNVPLARTEVSVLGTGNKETVFDYDNDGDAIPNESPTHLLSRVIEKGLTRDISGTIVPFEYITTITYNSKGQILSVDGPLPGNGDTTSFAYNAATGDLLSITRPLIGTTGFSNYDAAGQAGQMTDINGQSNSFTYDGRGRITIITHQADGSISSVSYTTAGLPDSSTDEDGVISNSEYDPVYGRLARRIDNEGNYITFNYDAQGNMIQKSYYDPTDNRTSWKRSVYQDPAHSMPGKLFKTINPDDTFTRYNYDGEGNTASVTDPNGNTTFYDYDALNRLTTVTQPGSVVTSYDYDIHGNLSSVMDAESHETTYEYDDMGRVLATTSPDTGTVFYAYDEAGRLTHKTDAKGITVGYTYDLLNRLTNVGFPDSTQDIGFTYDAGTYGMGHRTGMTDPSGSTTFGYDSRGRLAEKTITLNGHTYSIARTFTPGSRVISTAYPTARTVDYTRNSIGKISGVSTTNNGTTTTLISNLLYLPFGPASGMTNGGGSGVANVFDELYRTIVTNPGAEMERNYTYDANSNLTFINVNNDVSRNKTFTYDALNRLISANGSYGTINYTYDDVGNRIAKVTNDDTETYTYVAGTNKLQEITGPVSYTHDANGNITGIGNKVLTYNQNNRLVQVEENSTILGEYVYNGLGQRVIKTANGVTTIFVYDFNGSLIGESQADGTTISEYLYMGTSRIAKVDIGSGEIYYFHNDHLGTPVIMTDATGNAVWEAEFKPFGEANVKSTSTVNNNFRLPGQIFDEETGFNFNYFRDYHPGIGRYIEADPIGLEGGINLFAYVSNNPVNYFDSWGLQSLHYHRGGPTFTPGEPGRPGAGGGPVVDPNIGIDPSSGVAGNLSNFMNRFNEFSYDLKSKTGSDLYQKLLSEPDRIKSFEDEMKRDEEIRTRDAEEATSTIPEEYTPLPEPEFQFDPSRPDEIDRDSSITLSVIGGCSPYTWSVSGTDFTLDEVTTTGLTNTLNAGPESCGTATITVTSCNDQVKGFVRSKEGYWDEFAFCLEASASVCTSDAFLEEVSIYKEGLKYVTRVYCSIRPYACYPNYYPVDPYPYGCRSYFELYSGSWDDCVADYPYDEMADYLCLGLGTCPLIPPFDTPSYSYPDSYRVYRWRCSQ